MLEGVSIGARGSERWGRIVYVPKPEGEIKRKFYSLRLVSPFGLGTYAIHLLVFTAGGSLPVRDTVRLTCEFHPSAALTSMNKVARMKVLNHLEEITAVYSCRERI